MMVAEGVSENTRGMNSVTQIRRALASRKRMVIERSVMSARSICFLGVADGLIHVH